MRLEVLPLEQLHDEVAEPRRLVDAGGYHLHDVRAVDPRADLRFLLEAPLHVGVQPNVCVHHLQGAQLARALLRHHVDGAHPAVSEPPRDREVAADHGPFRELAPVRHGASLAFRPHGARAGTRRHA